MRGLLLGMTIVLSGTGMSDFLHAGEKEDRALANKVAQNLKTGGQLKSYEIGVMCREGTAWLKGTVTSQRQASLAIQQARQTEGVKFVVDLIEIKPPAAKQVAHHQPPQRPTTSAKQQAVQEQAASAIASKRLQVSEPIPATSNQQADLRQVAHQALAARRTNTPLPYGRTANQVTPVGYGQPLPAHVPGPGRARPIRHDSPQLPGYAWPSYSPYPNYGALSYPKQYSPTAWPYIGPFYPYPQVPLGWRKVTLEWDDGWWMLDFRD